MENAPETSTNVKRGRGRPKKDPATKKPASVALESYIRKKNTAMNGVPAMDAVKSHGNAENAASSTSSVKSDTTPMDAEPDPLLLSPAHVMPYGPSLDMMIGDDDHYGVRISQAEMQRFLNERRIYAQSGALYLRDAK